MKNTRIWLCLLISFIVLYCFNSVFAEESVLSDGEVYLEDGIDASDTDEPFMDFTQNTMIDNVTAESSQKTEGELSVTDDETIETFGNHNENELVVPVQAGRVLFATPTNITIKDSGRVTVSFYGDGSAKYNIQDTSIVSCEWDEDWNGTNIGLTITALRTGTTTIVISNSFNAETVTIYVTCIKEKLNAVSGLKAIPTGANKVKLSWNTVSGADGYLILCLNSSHTGKQIGYTGNRTWTDTNADSTAFNFYWVVPYYKNSAGKVVAGPIGNYVYAIGRIIDPVGTIKTTSGVGRVDLSWGPANGANAYIVLIKTGNKTDRQVTTKTSYTDYTSGEIRYYWVYGVYKGSNGNTIVAGKLSPYAWGKGSFDYPSGSLIDITPYLNKTLEEAALSLKMKYASGMAPSKIYYTKNGIYSNSCSLLETWVEGVTNKKGQWCFTIKDRDYTFYGITIGTSSSTVYSKMVSNGWKRVWGGNTTMEHYMKNGAIIVVDYSGGVVSKFYYQWILEEEW